MTIPDTLPVGISRAVLFNRSANRKFNRPEDRRPAFRADIGFRGERWAKHFTLVRHGTEEAAFAAAVKWRAGMAQTLGRAVRAPAKLHRNFGRPGRRRSRQPA